MYTTPSPNNTIDVILLHHYCGNIGWKRIQCTGQIQRRMGGIEEDNGERQSYNENRGKLGKIVFYT